MVWSVEYRCIQYTQPIYLYLWRLLALRILSPGQTIATCQHNMSQHCWAQHVACVWPPCCDMLGVVGSKLTIFKFEPTTPNMSQHIATRWPNARNRLRPTMLRHVALACCDRLAGALWKVRERTFDNRENIACVTVRKNKTVLLDT